MADLLGANRSVPSEERTVPDEETDADAFDGLPVGSSLDEAARAMRSPAPTPSSIATGGGGISSAAGAVPELGEDPLSLALRIAHQAQAAALAAAAAAEAPLVNGAAHPESEPIAEPTAPGIPTFTNGAKADSVSPGASSEVGVVPEEPDNEDTVRRAANATASTVDSGTGAESTIPEPTLPSESDMLVSDTSDSGPVIGEDAVVDERVGGEETPALTEAQRASLLAQEDESEPDTVIEEPSQPGTNGGIPGGIPGGMGGAPVRKSAIPDSPTAEPTPSAPRPAPMPAEPREEPTIRKTGPPPALVAPARLAPRTGTGPSGIGALGFRISANRAVVRPNGRASSPSMSVSAAPTTPSAGTPMSGSTSIERVSMERSIDRPSRTAIPAPRAPQQPPVVTTAPEPPPLVSGRVADRAGVPPWLIVVGAGLAMLLIAGVTYLIFGGGKPDAPVATPTPFVENTPEPMDTGLAVLGTPVATLTSAPATRTPQPTLTSTPRSTSTPTATPAATAVAIASIAKATPTVAAKFSAKERIEQIVKQRTPPDPGASQADVYLQAKSNLADAEFLFEAFRFLATPPTSTPKKEAELSKKLARGLGKEYLRLYRTTNTGNANVVIFWTAGYDKTMSP